MIIIPLTALSLPGVISSGHLYGLQGLHQYWYPSLGSSIATLKQSQKYQWKIENVIFVRTDSRRRRSN